MKISYLVTCHNETTTLKNLLDRLLVNLGNDEIIILRDDTNPISEETRKIISSLNVEDSRIGVFEHRLNNNYGGHKDWGASKCSGDYIFQIDGDELPSEYIIGENLHAIIEANNNVELIYVPRINDFRGVSHQHALQWGWGLSESPTYERPRVNFPDWQGRIFKREPSRIKWDRRLHEKLIGHTSYSYLPEDEEFALYHNKTIEKQIETNIRYNKLFSQEENMGHNVI
jgi:glycosyltransferase involved in cell wall biosynthesis